MGRAVCARGWVGKRGLCWVVSDVKRELVKGRKKVVYMSVCLSAGQRVSAETRIL